MTPGLTLKSVPLGTLVVVGSATAADAPKITVTNVDKIVGPDFLGDKPVKFAPTAQISNVGILAGQVKKIRLHTHELEDHVVYAVRGQAAARLGDERRARAAQLRAKGRRALRDPRERNSGLGTAQRPICIGEDGPGPPTASIGGDLGERPSAIDVASARAGLPRTTSKLSLHRGPRVARRLSLGGALRHEGHT